MEAYIRQERQREAVAQYLQSYREQPETEEEIAAASTLSTLAFSQEPWE